MRWKNVSNRGGRSSGSKPSTRKHSSDQYLISPVAGIHAQLPVWLSLCASAKYASLSCSFSSAFLRSSISVFVPYHFTIFPSSSRCGTARLRLHRFEPDAVRFGPHIHTVLQSPRLPATSELS